MRLFFFALAATAFGSPSLLLGAGVDTWTGASSASFSASGNWSGADTPPATGDSLVFTGTSGAGPTLSDNLFTPGSYTFTGLTFSSGALAYVINPATSGTNGFTLNGSITNNSTNLETINDIITLGGAGTINAASGAVTLGGTITGGSFGLTVLGTNQVTLSGTSNALAGLTLGTSVTATSNQNVALTGEYGTTTNLNSTQNIGALTVGTGLNIINVAAGAAITSTTLSPTSSSNDRFDALNINLGSGASMTTTATNDSGGVLVASAQFNAVTLNGTDFASNSSGNIVAATYTTLGTTSTSSQNSNVTGSVTLSGNQTMNSLRFGGTTGYTVTTSSGSTLSLNGSSNGTGSILMGANDGAVTDTVTGGTLQGSSNRGYSFLNYDTTSGANLEIDSNISIYGLGSFSASTANVMVAGGGLVTLGGANFINGEILVDLSTLKAANDSNLGGVNGTVSVTSATTGSNSVTLAAASNTTGLAVGDVFLGQIVTNVSSTTVTLASNYTGTSITSATNVGFVGGGSVNLDGGTLEASNTFALGETTSTGGTTSTRNRNVGLGVQGGSIDVTGTNTFTVPGVISGTGALTKTDTGTLTLTGVNTYTGSTTVSGGTLLISGTGQLNSGSYAGNIADNATFQYGSSANQTLSGVFSGSGTLIQSGGATLTLSNASNSYASTLIDYGTVAQTASNALGTGTITLGDGSTSNSATLLNASGSSLTDANPITIASGGSGTYLIEDTNPVSGDFTLTGGIALNNAATFKVTGGGAIFVNGTITGSSLITVDGGSSSGKFVDFGANDSSSFTGNILVQNKGDLKFGNGVNNALGTQTTVTLDSTSTMDTGLLNQTVGGLNDVLAGAGGSSVIDGGSSILTIGGSGSYSFSGVISGSGTLVKNGAGTQALAGTNTYSGATTINAGVLQIGTGGSTGTLGTVGVVLGGGTLSFNRSDTAYSVGNVISGSGTVAEAGTGETTLTAANSYSGTTTVNSGTLQVLNATGSATGTSAVNVGGASSSSYGTLTGGSGDANSGTLYTGGYLSTTPSRATYNSSVVGVMNGNVTLNSNGHLAPGSAGVGTITMASLTVNSGAVLNYEFNSTANDFTAVTGTLTLNGGSFNLYQEGTTNPFNSVGTYNLFNYGTTGTLNLSALTVADSVNGYSYTFSQDSNDSLIQLTIATSAVPEPQTWALLFAGGVLLVLTQRRRLA